jgi:cytochrome c5
MMKTITAAAAVLSLSFVAQGVSAQTGEEIVAKHCKACHDAGVGGAPKLDDKAAWEPRLAKGTDGMLSTVLSGKGAMPPKGTCMSCSEDELKAAIDVLTAGVR